MIYDEELVLNYPNENFVISSGCQGLPYHFCVISRIPDKFLEGYFKCHKDVTADILLGETIMDEAESRHLNETVETSKMWSMH